MTYSIIVSKIYYNINVSNPLRDFILVKPMYCKVVKTLAWYLHWSAKAFGTLVRAFNIVIGCLER